MPIYEYQGQQYDISTKDPAEAKEKILGYISKNAIVEPPKPAPIVTPPEKGNALTNIVSGLATGAGKLMATPTEFTGLLSGEKPYKAEDTPEALLKSAGIPSSAEDVYKSVLNTLTPKSALGLEGIQNKISGLGSGILNPFKATQPLSAELQAAGESIKSTKEKRLEAERAAAIDKEEGLLNEAKTAMGFTLSNPSMLPGFIAEQIPNLLLPAGAGKLGINVAKSLITNATEKALTRIGVSSAVAAAAAQQGGDTGADTYEAVHKYLITQGVPEKEAHDIAVEKSKVAAGKAAAISVATGFIPGANALERKLIGAAETGVAKKGLSKYATTGLNIAGEATQEGIEEGGGKYVSNVGLQQVAPETDVMKGVGSSAGLGMLGGAIFGGLTHGAGRTPSTQTPTTKNEWVLDENGNLVKNEVIEEKPKGTVTLGPIETATQQDLFGAGELPNQVDQGILNEKQRQESEIERNIFALQQQEQTPEVKQQIEALQAQLPKGPGQTIDVLKEEHSALSRAHTALDTQKVALEQQRNATPKLDDKLVITEQIKAIEAQQTQIDTRRAELQEQAKKLAKQITPEETTAQRKLKEVSPIVGNVMSKFGLTPKAPIRNAIKNLDMTVPEDRQTFIDEINKHSIKGAKINMEEVEKYLSYFEEKPSGELNRVDTGAIEPSVSVPGERITPTERLAAPVVTGMENNIGTPVGLGAGTETLQNVQSNSLALFKPEGIAQNLGDKSRSIVVMMPIQQFLDLSSEGGVDRAAQERANKRVAEGTEFTTVPHLILEHDKNGDATVASHDGRHRARALLAAGYTEMPVELRSPRYRWNRQGDVEDRDYIQQWPTTLKAQDNASNPNYTVPFPVSREQAAKYNYSGVTPAIQAAPETPDYGREINPNTAAVLQQPNVTMGAIPTSNVVEGQATVSPKQVEVQNDAVHDELTSKEQTQLAVIYGQDTYNDVAKARFIDDFIKAINEGLDKVHKVVAAIVRRLQATVLATAIIMNPNYMSPASIVLMPVQQQITTTEQVRAEVPKEVKGMSDDAKKAYSVLMPALQDQGKYFTIVDKPSATVYVFNSDGSLVKQSKVLLGKAFGDFYKGSTDFVQNRITPAGNFVVNAEKGGDTYDGKTIYTVGNVDEGWSAAIFHTVYTKESDAKDRLAALGKEGPEDSRYSHGCINGSPDLMETINNEKMDKSHMFVVPDNPELLDSFISNTVPNTDLTRATVKPKTVTKTTTERGQGISTTGGEDQFAIRREDSKTAALEELKKQKKKPRNVTPSELAQAKELFGEYANDSIALLRSGFTLNDIAKALGIIKNNLPTSDKINELDKAYEAAGGQKAMPNVGRIEKTINQVKSLKKSYDDNQDVAGSFFKAITNITSTANVFSFDRAYSNRIRSVFIDLKNKGDITLEQFKLATLRISISQALYRKDLAKKFLSMGNLVYDKITNRWEAINDDINWGKFETLIKDFATDIGGTPEQALKYMSKAYEANRVLDDYKQMDKLSKDITITKNKIDTLSKNKSRSKAEEKELNTKKELIKELTKQYQHQVDLVQHMTRAQAQAGVNDMLNKHPAIKQGLDILNIMKQRAVKIMVDTGVKNEDIAKDWINDLTYVPFNRQIDDAKEGSAILSRNLKEVMQERRKEGSMLEVNNTIENMFEWYQWAISRAISNQQMNVMIDQYKAVLPDEVRKGKGPKENTFSVYKNGVEQFYHVTDPAIAQAFLGMETMVFPGIGAFMTFKNSFSHLITRMPLFPIVQLFEDTYDAMTTSGLKHPFGLLKEVGKEIIKTTTGTSEARAKLSAAGVLMTHDTSALTTADDLTKKLNLDDPSVYRKTMNALDKWAAVNDNIVRQAVYAQGIKEGLSHAMAMEKAVELINFRRVSGNPAVVFASKIIPFFGATMQVTDVALKTITGRGTTPQERKEGLKVLLSTTAKMAAISFLYAAAASGDDDYKKKTRISRDQSFVIPGTNGFSIPVRPGLFSINKLIGEYGYKYLMEHSTDAPEEFAKAMAHGIMKQFTPPSTTLVTPTLGLYLNRDMYNNRDIVNPTMRKLLPEDQYNKYTSEMAKALAAGTGISALKIDYFLKAYFSSVASLTALATNSFIADMRGIPLPTMSTRDMIVGFPSMSKFMSKEETSDAVADFYDTTKDIATLVDTINNVGPYNPEKAKKLMEKPENAKLLKGADAMERAKEILQNLNSHERYILEQPESKMNADEKAKEIKKINAEREKVRNVTKNIKESIK